MALSQVQCLDDNHVNWRSHESKPEFFYSEDQRLALEALIHSGQGAFQEYVQAHSVRPFLSELEVEQMAGAAEIYRPGCESASGEDLKESEEPAESLQYWPERSDCSIPELDLGWPDCTAYRGVTRVNVYTQPPMDGQMHIKEVVRKTIAQAQKVIAVVMDLFTDVDIFKDLLDACFKRKLAVYIILDAGGIPHFLSMCERAEMHTGHIKNLRVRSTGGAEFYTRSLKKVQGSMSQKFMFVDGDRAVSGSYSYTWTASRLDRNLITVLTGQAVETFDRQFQDLYLTSGGINLGKISLKAEPEPEPLPQATVAPVTSAAVARKLINPKYALVSCNGVEGDSRTSSDKSSAKNSNTNPPMLKVQPTREVEMPPIHPGLLNLERANMINYLPTWPEPDPPSDVIGFINIRDSSKPMQVHLMRSELFETSQAIRFKDPFVLPEESLPDKACPRTRPENVLVNQKIVQDQQHAKPEPQRTQEQQVRNPSQPVEETLHTENIQREKDTLSLPLPIPKPTTVQVTVNSTDKIALEISLSKKAEPKLETPSSPQGKTHQQASDSHSTLICGTTATSTIQPCKESKEGAIDGIAGVNVQRVEQKECLVEASASGFDCKTVSQTKYPKEGSRVSTTSKEYYECNDSDHVDSQLDLKPSEVLKHPDELSTIASVSQSMVQLQLQNEKEDQQLPVVIQTHQERKQRQPDGHLNSDKRKQPQAPRSPASNIRSQQESQGRGAARMVTAKPDGNTRQPKTVGPVTGGHKYWQGRQLAQSRPGQGLSLSQDTSSSGSPSSPAQTQLGHSQSSNSPSRHSSPYRRHQVQLDRSSCSQSRGRHSSPYRQPQTQLQTQLHKSRSSHSPSQQSSPYRQNQIQLSKSRTSHQSSLQGPTPTQGDSQTPFFTRLSQFKTLKGKVLETPLGSPQKKASLGNKGAI